MNLLITAGATREPIDAVRFLSNVSTGRTGAMLADAFSAEGHRVLLLHGLSAVRPQLECDRVAFSSAEDLSTRLRSHLGSTGFDAVIMTAAVSDYRAEGAVAGKMSSAADEILLRLVRNDKILPQLKEFSREPVCVVGFKLTVGAEEPARRIAVAAQFQAGGVDLVVHNDLDEIRAAPREKHPFRVYTSADADPRIEYGVPALGQTIESLLSARCRAPNRSPNVLEP